MPAPRDSTELLQLLEKSGLFTTDQLREIALASKGVDPKAICESLRRREWITAFHVEQIMAGRWRGLILGPYKILALVGVGESRVYLAEHREMRRRVALRAFSRVADIDIAAEEEQIARESRFAATICHPNCVQHYDVGSEGNVIYRVMEFVEGRSIGEMAADGGALHWIRAANYVCQIAHCLTHALQCGCAHGCLRPSCLFVDQEGRVKVDDFGRLAHRANSLNREQAINEPANTGASFWRKAIARLTSWFRNENAPPKIVPEVFDYLSPEQAHDRQCFDIRSDIYSLGCVFYFMLTSRPPFPGGSAAEKLVAHQTQDPVPIAELIPDIPPKLATTLHRMIAKAPSDRIASPEEVGRLICRFAESYGGRRWIDPDDEMGLAVPV